MGNIIHNYPFGAATTASRNELYHRRDDEGSIPRFSNDSVTKHRREREKERRLTPQSRRSPPFKQPFASETKYQHGARHKERKKHSPKVRHAVCTAA